jgi:hypothetical protein
MSNHRWIKARTKHAHGPGDWRFRFVDLDDITVVEGQSEKKLLQLVLEQLHDKWNTQGEGWRGVEGEFVDKPPRSVLEKKIENIGDRIEQLTLERQLLESTLAGAEYEYVVQLPRDSMGLTGGYIAAPTRGGRRTNAQGVKFAFDIHEAKKYELAKAEEVAQEHSGTVVPY